MSVAEFDATLQDRIFNKIKDTKRDARKEYIQSLDTKKLRTKYESAQSGASSVFTESGLTKLKQSFIQDVINLDFAADAVTIVNSINYRDFANYAINNFSTKAGIITNESGILRLKDVPQNKLQKLFLEYVDIVISTSNIKNQPKVFDYLAKNIQSGHLAGVFSLKLKEVLNLDITSTGSLYREFTVTNNINEVTKNSLEMIIKALLDADYVTSNIYDKEEIFANAAKSVLGNNPHLEIELQFAKDNEAAGDLLKQTGYYLNALLDRVSGNSAKQLGQYTDREGTVQAFTNIIKSLKPLAEMLIKRAKELQTIDAKNAKIYSDIFSNAQNLNKLSTALIDTKGSPSLKESIGQNIANLIGTGTILKQIVTKVAKKDIIKNKDPELIAVNASIKKARDALKQAKSKIDKKSKVSIHSPKTNNIYSLTSLQNLINQHLQSVVSANMADGSSRSILNYRTGRFAASATVERMSESRAGMITAFYTYMKNPYQTFEPGYAQGKPASRDPKLLISKSIREIAATKVGNRLRAVLI